MNSTEPRPTAYLIRSGGSGFTLDGAGDYDSAEILSEVYRERGYRTYIVWAEWVDGQWVAQED